MIKTYNSNKPGLNLVIMAGVHGDEKCGLEAFNIILQSFQPISGRITFIIGNPKAVAVNRREFEANLNRMFRPDKSITDQEKEAYEYKRARELMPILANADALLDIHSSTTKQTVPFIICEKQSYACVQYLPAKVVVSGIDALHPTGTDAFVNQSGGLGICIECGNHDDAAATEVAILAIKNFLDYFGSIDKKLKHIPAEKRFIQADWIYKNEGVFTLGREYREFEKIQKSEVIGFDGDKEIKAPYDGVILFPHNRTEVNTEAFLFGKETAY